MYDIDCFDHLIRVRLWYDWSQTTPPSFDMDYRKALSSLGSGPWATYIDFRACDSGVRPAISYMKELSEMISQRGNGKLAFLFDASINDEDSIVSEILNVTGLDVYLFSNSQVCTEWIRKTPFSTRNPEQVMEIAVPG